MLTGQQLYLLFQQAIGIAYTGQFGTVKAQRFCDRAFTQVCESNYDKNDTQKTRDNLSFLVSTNQVFQINNNLISVSPIQITSVSIVGTLGIILTALPTNLLTGQSVTISGVQGFNVNPNGTFVVTVLSGGQQGFTITVTPTTGAYTQGTGIIRHSRMIADYWHLLTAEAKFSRQIYDFAVTTISNANPCVVTFDFYNNISTGENITISSATGNTASNGTWFLKKLNEFQCALYQDKYFQTPVVGNGAYTGGAVLTRSWYNYCKPYISDVKIGELNIPSIQDPKIEIANRYLKVWPLTETCEELTVDYLRLPSVNIDIKDNVIDLENYYPRIFLNQIVSEMQIQASATLRDPESYQESVQQKIREGGGE